MARARSIKPGFFTNDALVELPFEARLLFIGLWTLADKEGRLIDRPKKIRMELFPADSVDCDIALSLIAEKGFISRYEVSGVRYIQVLNWKKHQNPHMKEADSQIPPESTLAPENPVRAPEIPAPARLTPDSGLPLPDSGLLTACNARAPEIVPRETLSAEFYDFMLITYPNTSHRKSFEKALGCARIIVSTGGATELDLRRRLLGFKAFCLGGGYSGPDKTPSPQSWFEHNAEDPYWAKEWEAPKSKAQQKQDDNIDASNQWLSQSGNA